jgi:hypothetical protein
MSFKKIILWSIIPTGLIALFWAIHYLVAGYVPTIHRLVLSDAYTIHLPFAISRWCDVLLGPLTLIAIRQHFKVDKSKVSTFWQILSLLACLIMGIIFHLFINPIFSLGYGMIVTLIFNFNPDINKNRTAYEFMTFGVVFSLSISLLFSIAFGMLHILLYGLIFGLLYGITHLSRLIYNN